MIKHIVLFKLKDKSRIEETKNVLLSMNGQVELLRGLAVGVDFLHSSRSYDIILEVTLDGPELLNAYQEHPYHAGVVKKHMAEVSESSVTVDYCLD